MATCTSKIWKWRVPCKIKLFIWLVLQGRILTKMYRAKWRPEEPTECTFCGNEPESIEHLLFNCTTSACFWERLGEAAGFRCAFHDMEELWQLMDALLNQGEKCTQGRFRRIVIPAGLWTIWRVRNAMLFKGQMVYAENLWDDVLRLLKDWGQFLVGARVVWEPGGSFRIDA
ncbi:hypothetical protein QJS10_CPB18g00674 [Acorus calamus]|uniref:Reverse transcriptase zinc-binding domain-containing protein n=1 Tax=Acorus calamus TaxID=4465 RepID=A0AAV9CKU0_ACOCL|nr:hypothetical protein QJS10_CPB18g00674 [Acorus calamus]